MSLQEVDRLQLGLPHPAGASVALGASFEATQGSRLYEEVGSWQYRSPEMHSKAWRGLWQGLWFKGWLHGEDGHLELWSHGLRLALQRVPLRAPCQRQGLGMESKLWIFAPGADTWPDPAEC